ncbi:aquaporin [Nocardia terpenica]|uniref:AraC family transcriptional regulator n=1 Tax=Nocardia terpenica TaxID=455432 RepID=A0A6G9YZF4_9NOCA|nr:aquaporin [Nocardia terpenica]QIS18705.1 AraC family transcriptional regulator [Nocardia terpenica]
MSPTAQEVVEEDPELPAVSLARKLLAEAIGTFVLVFGGVGTLVFAGHRVGDLGVALAFGFTLLFLVYAIGPISGCHVNPAVTLGHLLLGRIGVIAAVDYVVAQVLGGVAAGGVIYAIARDLPSYDRVHDGLGANGWGAHSPARLDIVGPLGGLAENGYGLTAAATVEILLTALLVFVVLASTDRLADVPLAGVSIGITLTVIHLISIPIDATSVNPVRSLAVAPYQDGAMSQLWAFLVFPLIGSAIGALAYALLFSRARPPVQ